MAIRFLLCLLLFVTGGVLTAQTSVSIGDSVADDAYHHYLIEVDQGSTATSVDVTVDLTTTGAAGLSAELFDLDRWSSNNTPWDEYDAVFGAGNLNFVFTLPARSGVHQLLLYIETSGFGAPSPYSGTVDVSAGTVAQAGFETFTYDGTPTRNYFDRVIESFHLLDGGGAVYVDVDIDFGSTSHSTTFFVTASATAASEFELLDVTSTPTSLYTLSETSPGQIGDSFVWVTSSYSGVRTFRFHFTKSGTSGLSAVQAVFGPDATIVGVDDPFISPPANSSSSSSSGSSGCNATPSETGGIVLGALIAILAIRSGLRRKSSRRA